MFLNSPMEQFLIIHQETDFFDDFISDDGVFWSCERCNIEESDTAVAKLRKSGQSVDECYNIYDIGQVLTGFWNKNGGFYAIAILEI